MKIVIAGAGEVGTHLAKMLSQENQDIILMDPNEERLNFSKSSMEILPMVGNPTESITTNIYYPKIKSCSRNWESTR